MRRLGGVASLLLGAVLVCGAPSAQAADRVDVRFGAPTRTIIDNGPPGTSVGDITVTTGDVLDAGTGKRIGFYTTNQVTVRADAATGREIRKVDLSIVLPTGTVFATSLIRAASNTPPASKQVFAITGGLGAFEGIRGTVLHDAVEGRPGFSVSIRSL